MRHVLLCVAVLGAANARADSGVPPALQGVDVVERLGEPVPLDLPFVDADGHPVRLRDTIRGDKPVIVNLVYYDCPMLCDLVTNGLLQGMRTLSWKLGREFRVLTVSFNPRENIKTAKERRRGYHQSLGYPIDPADWKFLHGGEREIRALTDALGFRYRYDPVTRTYAHPAVLFVLTPEGRISRYLYGVQVPQRDLKLALTEAALGRVGTSFERLLLNCYRYDPATRRYGLFVTGFLRLGGLLVLIALGTLLVRSWRRELAQARQSRNEAAR